MVPMVGEPGGAEEECGSTKQSTPLAWLPPGQPPGLVRDFYKISTGVQDLVLNPSAAGLVIPPSIMLVFGVKRDVLAQQHLYDYLMLRQS